MPNFDIQTVTPGSAVADTLQQILARRKEEERQVLLDKMAQEEHQSTLAARQEQMRLAKDTEARQKAASEAQIAESNENILQSKFKNLGRGTTPDQIGDPSLIEEGRKRGGFESIPVFDSMPEVGQEGLPSARMQESWRGTLDEQSRDRLETQFDELIMNTDDEQARQALGIQRAGGQAPASMFPSRKAPLTTVSAGGRATQNPDIQVPENQSVVELNHPPLGPAALLNPSNYKITYKPGQGVGQPTSRLMYPADAIKMQSDPTVESVIENPRAEPVLTGSVINRAQQALSVLEAQEQLYQNSGYFDWSKNVTPDLQAARAGAEQAMAPIMANAPSDLAGLAQRILQDPADRDKTVAQLVQEGTLSTDGMSQEDIETLHLLVTYMRAYSKIRNQR